MRSFFAAVLSELRVFVYRLPKAHRCGKMDVPDNENPEAQHEIWSGCLPGVQLRS
jgi:hypothetical protein